MKIISWNVNGIQGLLKKDLEGNKYNKFQVKNRLSNLIEKEEPDFLCLQEIRCSAKFNASLYLPGYIYANHSKIGKGYSGTMIIAKEKPISVIKDFGTFDSRSFVSQEGRVITLEYEDFYLVNVYTPNSKDNGARLSYRVNVWDNAFLSYIKHLQKSKKVITCGDFNVVPSDLDSYKPMKKFPGATPEEQKSFHGLLNLTELIDSYRIFNPKGLKWSWHYPWHRKAGLGCRLDFCLIPLEYQSFITRADILDTLGSDHQPIILSLDLDEKEL